MELALCPPNHISRSGHRIPQKQDKRQSSKTQIRTRLIMADLPNISPNCFKNDPFLANMSRNLKLLQQFHLKHDSFLTKPNRQRIIKYLHAKQKGLCYLCKEEISLEKQLNTPDTKSIDHYIPTSKGGSNHLYNLRLTHRRCNSFKSDNPVLDKSNYSESF